MHPSPSRPFIYLLLAAGLSAPAVGWSAGFAVVGVDGSAAADTGDERRPLRVADVVEPGTSIYTGRGRIELHLEPAGAIALGDDSRVLLHSIEPLAPPARMHLVRLVVDSGSMRASTRAASTPIPADLRINIGGLRLRVLGAEVWMERGRDFDEVCVIEGAVELQTPAGPHRLDEPGSCLRLLATGIQHLDPAAAAPITPRLQRTALAVLGGLSPSTASVPSPAIEASPSPMPAPPPPPPQTAAPAATGAEHAWTIVLASVPDEDAARREAERLRAGGLDTRVVDTLRDDGSRTWRVVVGRYASKADAATDIASIRKRRGLAKAWITQQP
jgi:cell division septation protein DedD